MVDVTALSDLARSRHLHVAVAESLTSGALASAVGAGAEASTWFSGGVVAYLPEVKEWVLGFPADRDPTSAECAEQLARGARELLDADLCVSTTGVGGPDAEDGHPREPCSSGGRHATAPVTGALPSTGSPTRCSRPR